MNHIYTNEVTTLLAKVVMGTFNSGIEDPGHRLVNILSGYEVKTYLPRLLACAFHTDEDGLNALLANNALASRCDSHGGDKAIEVLQAIVTAARESGKYTHTFALKPELWEKIAPAKEAKQEAEEKAEVRAKTEEEVKAAYAPAESNLEKPFEVKQVNSLDELLAAIGMRKAH